MTWDWRNRANIIGPVKNQTNGRSSDWALAIASALEAQYGLKYDNPIQLSAQQLLDCANVSADESVEDAFQYIANYGGIAKASAYKYTGVPGQCYFNLTTPAIQTYGLGWESLMELDEEIIQTIFDKGPVVSSDFLVAQDFIDYKTGVFTSSSCLANPLFNHTLLIIGYGKEQVGGDLVDYWLVQNSWGIGWGSNGFAKIQRGVNLCGVTENVF